MKCQMNGIFKKIRLYSTGEIEASAITGKLIFKRRPAND